jgi:hypothetical protein
MAHVPAPYIVCGFYTPDYAHWLPPLIASLDAHAQPHDFLLVPKTFRGWEANTRVKPMYISDAMSRHPSSVIIFLDVDCLVRGDLSPLASLHGDVALNITIQRQRGRGIWLRARSGTLVLKPNFRTRYFVHSWIDHCRRATYGEDGETALSRTIISDTDASIQQLHPRWRAPAGSLNPDDMIIHDSASRHLPKVCSATRWIARHLTRRRD